MQTSYHLTPKGLKYAISSHKKDDAQLLLLFILEKYSNTPISFEKIKCFYQGDKIKTFKQICILLDLQLLKIQDIYTDNNEIIHTKPSLDEAFVMSDLNGLVIQYHNFNPAEALQISADAVDLIRVSRRNRDITRTAPLSVEIAWQDKTITTYHLFLNHFSLLLTCKTKNIFNQELFTPFISYFCNRYNYE